MFEDDDLIKAGMLQDVGHYPDLELVELAKLIYERRQQNTDKDGQPQLLRG